ncbi:MAG: type III secretion system stator protein SctL [Chthoniobacterales bacterium]
MSINKQSTTLVSWDEDLPSYLQQGPILLPEKRTLCLEAVDLLEKARSRAAAIVEEAQLEFERQKKSGYEQGLEEGRKAAAAHNIKTVLASLDYYEQSRNQLVQIVISCLRRFIMDLPPEEQMYQLVGKALDLFKNQPRIVLQVHSNDRDAVEASILRLQELMPSGSKIEIRVHDDLNPKSCVLESPLGLIDASLESQLAILEGALLEAAKVD